MLPEHEAERLGLTAELLENLPAAVGYLVGAEHRCEFANTAYIHLVGGRDVVGRPVSEALPELVGQGYLQMLDEVFATGEPRGGRESVAWLRDESGELRRLYFDFRLEPVRSHGQVLGVVVHAVDVTAHVVDHQRLENLAAEAAERYEKLFETMLQGVVYHGRDGAIVSANAKAAEILGQDREALVGLQPREDGWQAVREDGSPFPVDDQPAMVALREGKVVADVVMGVTQARTGERRWLSVTAVPDALDEQGRPQRVYAMFGDVTEQRRTAEALREQERLLGRLRDANVLGILLVDERRVVDANDAFLQMVGYDRADLEAGRVDWRAMTPPDWQARTEAAVDELRRTGACEPFEKEYVHASGRRVPVLLGSAVVDRDPMRWVTFVSDLSERQRAEDERVELLARAQAARAEAERADEQLGLLLRAGALVASMHDRGDLLRHVTRLVVPAVADFAGVLLPTEDGSLLAAAVEDRDPERAVVLERMREHPIRPETNAGMQAVYRAGESQLVHDAEERLRRWAALEPGLAEIVRRLDVGSLIAVPLSHGADKLGVLALARAHDRAAFTAADVPVAEELGRRLAVGLTSAEAFEREHTVAEMLQRSVLPDELPRVPGVGLAVVYLPATEGVEVGGDWYDAFPLDEGRLGLVLGDVVGHNLASASVMNQVRNAVRAYAVDSVGPDSVLARTNSALVKLLPGALATVFYGVLDVRTGELTYASAGHPPPLLVGPEGPAFLTDASGVMLGVDDDVGFGSAVARLRPGQAVLLYSDGLVEDRSRSLGEGLDALAAVFAHEEPAGAEKICAAAQAALLEGPTRADDVCLLAVRLE